jgi:TRAP-type transport system periplasmic protein
VALVVLQASGSWDRLPPDIKEVVSKNVNAAAVAQRQDVARLNASLKDELASKGLVFNDVDRARFQDVLRNAGFYLEWKNKYGEELWQVLEESTRKLA